MQVRNHVLGWAMLATLLSACSEAVPSSAPAVAAPPAEAVGALPIWMRSAEWAQRPWAKTPVGAVWRVRHAGQEAWLVDAPGMAQDTLVRSDGAVICKPAGFGNAGDGRCPTVLDAGTPPHLAWSHPGNPSPTFGPPPPAASMDPPPVAVRKPARPREPLPAWLERKVAQWERQGSDDVETVSVSRLQHKGATAYLFYANCCDQFNTLYDAEGRELCSPSGGLAGEGDGMCPAPEDPGTKQVTVWEHPSL